MQGRKFRGTTLLQANEIAPQFKTDVFFITQAFYYTSSLELVCYLLVITFISCFQPVTTLSKCVCDNTPQTYITFLIFILTPKVE